MKRCFAMIAWLTFLFSSVTPFPPQTRGWRGIVPLHSTRQDVERILGPAMRDAQGSYYLQDMNVFVRYSTGDCSKDGAWNVPPDTVVGFDVIPKPSPRLADSNIDRSKFKMTIDYHVEGWVYYTNEEDGITLAVTEGRIRTFWYFPAKADQSLACPPHVWFSSDIPVEARKRLEERLEQYATYIRGRQFEKLFELYLPEIATKMFPVKDKHEFASWAPRSGLFNQVLIDLKLISVTTIESHRYGNVRSVFAVLKTSNNGETIQSRRLTDMVLKNGEWYFIDFLNLTNR